MPLNGNARLLHFDSLDFKLKHTGAGRNPVNSPVEVGSFHHFYEVLYIPGGAALLPSTVFISNVYVCIPKSWQVDSSYFFCKRLAGKKKKQAS